MIGAVFFLKILAAKTYRTPRGLHQTCRWLGSSDELAFRDEAVIEESTAAPSAPMLGKPVYTPGDTGMSASHEMGMGSGGNGVTHY